MALHSFIEYLKYSWKAKGRHGTHSPFVYDLVENVLMDKGTIKPESVIEYRSLPLKYENLISRIALYYGCKNVLSVPAENSTIQKPDMLLLNDSRQWAVLFEHYAPVLNGNTIVVVPHIHQTVLQTRAWGKIVAHPQVRMSIDLYGIGLLLFREEFKEKQHFVLKY